MGWLGFVVTVVIALIVGSIFKIFKEARGGNFFAALIGAQLGLLLASGAGRVPRGIVAIVLAIIVSWLLSLEVGKKEAKKASFSGESSETPSQ